MSFFSIEDHSLIEDICHHVNIIISEDETSGCFDRFSFFTIENAGLDSPHDQRPVLSSTAARSTCTLFNTIVKNQISSR